MSHYYTFRDDVVLTCEQERSAHLCCAVNRTNSMIEADEILKQVLNIINGMFEVSGISVRRSAINVLSNRLFPSDTMIN